MVIVKLVQKEIILIENVQRCKQAVGHSCIAGISQCKRSSELNEVKHLKRKLLLISSMCVNPERPFTRCGWWMTQSDVVLEARLLLPCINCISQCYEKLRIMRCDNRASLLNTFNSL